jgi:aminoglycoside 6'-N-acetyltransferase
MSRITLRTALSADLPVLKSWDEKAHVIAASGDDGGYDWETELPRHPSWREFLIAEHDGRPIGVLQIIDPAEEETHYWGDAPANLRAIDIWIGEETDLGRGFGTEMMRLAFERCFASPEVEAVLIDPLASNVRARRFYERLGFTPVGRRTFGSDDCMVYRLDREQWHATTLQQRP